MTPLKSATADAIKEARRQGAIDNMIEVALRPGGTLDELAVEQKKWGATFMDFQANVRDNTRHIAELQAREAADRSAIDHEIEKRMTEVWGGINEIRKTFTQVAVGLGIGVTLAIVGLVFKLAFK